MVAFIARMPLARAMFGYRQIRFMTTNMRNSGSRLWAHAGGAAFSLAAAGGSVALCALEDKAAVKNELKEGDALVDSLAPLAQQLSVGSVMGYCTGYALRVVGRMAAFAVGGVFMMVQSASYSGYIDVNWKKIHKDSQNLIDANGDGKVNADDFKILLRKFVEVCTYNLPSGAGFTAGLALGLGFGGATAGKAAAVVSAASLVPRVVMAGTAATAGSGMMVAVKEQYDKAREATTGLITNLTVKKLSEDQIFTASLQSKDLPGLREVEKVLTKQLKSSKDKEEKSMLQARIDEVVAFKKAIKLSAKKV